MKKNYDIDELSSTWSEGLEAGKEANDAAARQY